jgi:hypothetical protein
LPGGKSDLEQVRYKTGLGMGTLKVMQHLIGPSSPAYDAIKRVAWDVDTPFFGSVVCPINFLAGIFFDSRYKVFEPHHG